MRSLTIQRGGHPVIDVPVLGEKIGQRSIQIGNDTLILFEHESVAFRGMILKPGRGVAIEYGEEAPGVAVIDKVLSYGAAVRLRIRWRWTPEDAGYSPRRFFIAGVLVPGDDDHFDEVELEAVHSTLTIFSGEAAMEEYEKVGDPRVDFVEIGRLQFFDKRRTKAGSVTLFKKEMPQLPPELPLQLARLLPTKRAPLEDGVGLAAFLVDSEGSEIVIEVPRGRDAPSHAYRLQRIGETRDYVLLLDKTIKMPFVHDEAVVCFESEREVMSCYLAQGIHQACLVSVSHGGTMYAPPAVPPHVMLQRLRDEHWKNSRLRECEQSHVLNCLLERVRAACRPYGAGIRFSAEVTVTPLTLATVDFLVREQPGRWQRGLFIVELRTTSTLPFPAGWYFFTTASCRAQKAGYSSNEYTEVVSSATTPADNPVPLRLVTDFHSRLGLRGVRRKWSDVAYGTATHEAGPSLPDGQMVPKEVWGLPRQRPARASV